MPAECIESHTVRRACLPQSGDESLPITLAFELTVQVPESTSPGQAEIRKLANGWLGSLELLASSFRRYPPPKEIDEARGIHRSVLQEQSFRAGGLWHEQSPVRMTAAYRCERSRRAIYTSTSTVFYPVAGVLVQVLETIDLARIARSRCVQQIPEGANDWLAPPSSCRRPVTPYAAAWLEEHGVSCRVLPLWRAARTDRARVPGLRAGRGLASSRTPRRTCRG